MGVVAELFYIQFCIEKWRLSALATEGLDTEFYLLGGYSKARTVFFKTCLELVKALLRSLVVFHMEARMLKMDVRMVHDNEAAQPCPLAAI